MDKVPDQPIDEVRAHVRARNAEPSVENVMETVLSQRAVNLAAYAVLRGLPEDAFDENVYDLAGAEALPDLNNEPSAEGQEVVIARFEQQASAINNGGFEAQFRFLLSGYGSVDEGERTLRCLIDERSGG